MSHGWLGILGSYLAFITLGTSISVTASASSLFFPGGPACVQFLLLVSGGLLAALFIPYKLIPLQPIIHVSHVGMVQCLFSIFLFLGVFLHVFMDLLQYYCMFVLCCPSDCLGVVMGVER